MICRPIKESSTIVLGIISVICLLLLYFSISYVRHSHNPLDTSIPNASQIVQGFSKIWTKNVDGTPWIISDIKATAERLFVGMSTGIIISLIIGISIGCYSWIAALLVPPLTFLAKIPPTALLAILFILFGTDFELFVAIISVSMIPSLSMSIYGSIQNDVSEDSLYKAYTLGASNVEVITNVVFPQIFPRILQALQLQIGPAMVFVIAAEWIMADVGFGYRLRMQSRLLNMNLVYVYLGILSLTGFLAERFLIWVRRKLCPWFGE